MSVSYEEQDGSPQEHQDENGITATRKLMCAYGNRWKLVAQLLTSPGADYEGRPGKQILARRASIEPLPAKNLGSGTVASYEKAIVTVEYSTPTLTWSGSGSGPVAPEPGAVRFAEAIEPSAEFLTIPVEYKDSKGVLKPLLKWGSGDIVSDAEAPGFLIRKFDWVITFFDLSRIPSQAFDYVGSVNDRVLHAPTLGLNFAKETVLHNMPCPSRSVGADGSPAWQVTYRFNCNPFTWNKFWSSKTQQPEGMYLVTGGSQFKPYALADLRKVFPTEFIR